MHVPDLIQRDNAAAPHLERRLGLLHVTALNMTNMIGMGPFITIPLLMSTINGGGPQCMLGWLVAILITIPDGMVWAELGASMPATGGSYVYLREGFGRETWGRMMAFLFIWQFMLSGPLEVSTAYIGFVQYLSFLWPAMTAWQAHAVIVAVGLFTVFLLYRHITHVGMLSVALWVAMLLTIGAVVATGAMHFDPKVAFDFPPGAFDFSLGFLVGLGAAGRIGIFDYLGYFNVCHLGEEVKDPGKNIPRSIVISIVAVALIYLAINLSIIGTTPWREFVPATDPPAPVVSTLMERIHGSGAATLFTVLVLVTILGSVFAILLSYSRIPYAAARDGCFFPVFGRLHPTKHFPHFALLLMGGITIVCAFFPLGFVVAAALTTRIIVQFMGQIAAGILLRRRAPDMPRPYRMWLYPLPSLIALVGWLFVLITSGIQPLVVGVVSLVLGMIGFLIWSRWTLRWPFAPVVAHHRLSVFALVALLLGSPALAQPPQAMSAASKRILPGQIVVDPDHPQWLKRHGGKHVFISGPGDPEDFLYRGQRNPDGTRNGDQVQLIRKLSAHGGNSIYLQIVRTHGGDAKPDPTQNPFVDSDPAGKLDEDILQQWEEWFTLMDRHEILIYLFFYDDSARIWDTGDIVGPQEQAFLETIVKRFMHHRNLIWVIGEESEERYTDARVQAIAKVIKDADEHGHLVGDHHLTGTTFKAWQPGGALNHFAMQLAQTDDAAHEGAIEALHKAAGRYQIIYSESTAMKTDVDGMRGHAWSVAMAGMMPMLLRMDIANTPVEALRQCRHLQRFFEATDFWTMTSHDGLKHAQTKYVLASPGRSYIAYADNLTGRLGIKNMPEGRYAVTWMDTRTGKKVVVDQAVSRSGDQTFAKPRAIGSECAAWIRRRGQGKTDGQLARGTFGSVGHQYHFPPPGETLAAQNLRAPQEVGLKPDAIARLKGQIKIGRWALWRHGYLVHVEGDFNQVTEVKSLRKTWHALAVGAAIQRGRIPSLQQKLSVWNPELTGKDADATWWHVITQTSGFDYPYGNHPAYRPGEMWTYSDKNPHQLCNALARAYGKRDYSDNYQDVIGPAYFDAIGMRGWKASVREDGIRFHFDLEDMGRLGLLVLARGEWAGRQIVARDFVEALETKQTRGIKANYEGPDDGGSVSSWLRARESPYGYMTWVNTDGDLFPGTDRAWAQGSGAGGAAVLWNHKNGIVFAGLGVDTRRGTAGIPHDIESCIAGPNPLATVGRPFRAGEPK